MSIISGVTVNWTTSPRIITIPDTETEVTIEDLQDTLLDLEDNDEGILWDHLRNTSGGEDLGGGVTVGWTMELQNAQIAFEPRTASDSSGTVTTPDTTGTQLIDSAADFITDGIQAGDTILNETDGSVATVISVDNLNTISCYALADGTDNQFDSSDSYKIWNKVQCEVSGGNLVAVDDVGSSISPILPTAFTHAIRTTSSSATLQELEALQYSTYQNSVWIDVGSSNSGTAYPVGNREYPVNNLSDAISIANERGFSTLQVLSDMTLDSGTDLSSFKVTGQARTNVTVTVDSNAITSGLVVEHCSVVGTLDGGTNLINCIAGELVYFNGEIKDCELYGNIYIDGNNDATIINCHILDQSNPPVIDMGGTGQSLAMPDFSGIITIKNLTSATEVVGIGLDAGFVTIDSTVTNGTINISGIGVVTDNSTGSASVDYSSVISNPSLADAVWDEDITTHTTTDTAGKKLKDIKNPSVLIDGEIIG